MKRILLFLLAFNSFAFAMNYDDIVKKEHIELSSLEEGEVDTYDIDLTDPMDIFKPEENLPIESGQTVGINLSDSMSDDEIIIDFAEAEEDLSNNHLEKQILQNNSDSRTAPVIYLPETYKCPFKDCGEFFISEDEWLLHKYEHYDKSEKEAEANALLAKRKRARSISKLINKGLIADNRFDLNNQINAPRQEQNTQIIDLERAEQISRDFASSISINRQINMQNNKVNSKESDLEVTKTRTSNAPKQLIFLNQTFTPSIPAKAPSSRISSSAINPCSEATPHKCPDCGKAYTHQGNLTAHMLSHFAEGTYKCEFPECNRVFIRQNYLNYHMRTHTREKPYKCNFEGCQKTYADKRDLNSHKLKFGH